MYFLYLLGQVLIKVVTQMIIYDLQILIKIYNLEIIY